MTKIKQDKIPVSIENEFKWKLIRERDNLTHFAHKIGWIEWNNDSTFKKKYDKHAIDRSLILDPHQITYTYITTIVEEILEEKENYTKFKTKNSTYQLWKLKND